MGLHSQSLKGFWAGYLDFDEQEALIRIRVYATVTAAIS
jgi:hypothetical protein